jgi:hypothetical protein
LAENISADGSETGAVLSSRKDTPVLMAADYAHVLGEVWESVSPIARNKLFDAVEENVVSGSQTVNDVWGTGFLEGLDVEIDKNYIPLDELLDCIEENLWCI